MYYYINLNYKIHLYGSGAIVLKPNGEHLLINASYLYTLKLCNGLNTIHNITDFFCNQIGTDSIKIESVKKSVSLIINELEKNEIINKQTVKREMKTHFYGKKNCYFPKGVLLEVTDNCNFKCTHCYHGYEHSKIHISLNTVNELCDKYSGIIPFIDVTGGELTTHPNINEILSKLVNCFEVNLLSNGSNIDRISTDILKKLHSIQISLYGYDENSFHEFTKSSIPFDKIIKNLDFLKQNNIPFRIAISFTKNNLVNIEKYLDFAYNHGAYMVKTTIPIPLGDFTKDEFEKNLKISGDDYDFLIKIEEEFAKNHADIIVVIPYIKFLKESKNHLNCMAGKLSIVCSPDENVRPCNIMNNTGNIKLLDYLNQLNNGSKPMETDFFVNAFISHIKQKGFTLKDVNCRGYCE